MMLSVFFGIEVLIVFIYLVVNTDVIFVFRILPEFYIKFLCISTILHNFAAVFLITFFCKKAQIITTLNGTFQFFLIAEVWV